MEIIWDIIVVGGGPAGMMAACRAAERAGQEKRTVKILILEKNEFLGKKLLITGGGRCNVTNAEFDNRTLLGKFKESGKFLFSAFAQYSVRETLDFFHSRDMPTKIENEKRVFPKSDSAQSVWNVLVESLGKFGVNIRSKAEVMDLMAQEKGLLTSVRLKTGEIIQGKNFILATGGKSHPETGSTGQGFVWLSKLGHAVSEPKAALVPVKTSDPWVKKLSGFSLPTAKITLFQNGQKVPGKQAVKKGKVLFTHFGLSGPAILNMSSEIGELLKYGELVLSLDLLPTHDYATLNTALQKLFSKQSNKKIKNSLDELIPSPLVQVIVEQSKINPDTFCHSITREERLSLVKTMKDLPVHPTGLLGTDQAIITSGGVSLTEVDFRTMRSRLIPNLYLIGDILDIDRPSGGYSLQLCWTTGWVAGNSAISPSPKSRRSGSDLQIPERD